MLIQVNSKSSGKWEEKDVNGRPHLVTTMVSIEMDSVMNGLLYPKSAVEASYKDIDNLMAPMGHPKIGGKYVNMKSNPEAVNAFHVGAYVKNPTIEGEFIHNDLYVDIELAGRDPRGTELMKRIKNSERIGVSTGLDAKILNMKGSQKGRNYNGAVSSIAWDHVANLLDEEPAGEHTYTVNSADDTILICNVDQSAEHKPKTPEKVLNNEEGENMDLIKLVNAILANSKNSLVEGDREMLMGMNETSLVTMLANKQNVPDAPAVTTEAATAVLESAGMSVINAAQKTQLDGIATAAAEAKTILVDTILANSSDFEKVDLEAMPQKSLEGVAKAVKPANAGENYGIKAAETVVNKQQPKAFKLVKGS